MPVGMACKAKVADKDLAVVVAGIHAEILSFDVAMHAASCVACCQRLQSMAGVVVQTTTKQVLVI